MNVADLQAELAAAIRKSPFHRLLDVELTGLDDASARVGASFRRELGRSDDDGTMHGGAIAALIDIAAAYAIRVRYGGFGTTVSLSVDYLRPVTGDRIEAEARIVRAGRTQALVDAQLFDGNALSAVGRARFHVADLS